MKEEDLDFEISFYERLIEQKGDFVEALIALGDAYTKKGLYGKGLEVDKRLIKLRPDDATVHYNLACDYSLLKLPDECLKELEKAILLGFDDFKFVEGDPDLDFIRKDRRYKELLAKYRLEQPR